MFIKESTDEIVFFDDNKRMPDVPDEVRTIDLTVTPASVVGPKSGAMMMSKYYQALKFCIDDYTEIQDAETRFYEPLGKTDGYVKFSDALNLIASELGGDVVFFKTIPFIKHFVHKFGICVIELQPDMSICGNIQGGVFDYSSPTGEMLDDRLTKGFIACGYDQTGLIVQNSLGTRFGSLGFARIGWDLLGRLLVKAGCVKNI